MQSLFTNCYDLIEVVILETMSRQFDFFSRWGSKHGSFGIGYNAQLNVLRILVANGYGCFSCDFSDLPQKARKIQFFSIETIELLQVLFALLLILFKVFKFFKGVCLVTKSTIKSLILKLLKIYVKKSLKALFNWLKSFLRNHHKFSYLNSSIVCFVLPLQIGIHPIL